MKAAGVGAGALALGVSASTTAAAEPQISTPWLHVDGNLVKDEDGNTVKLRGLNIADPKRMNTEAAAMGKTAEQAVDMLTDQDEGWYPRVIRIPVQPQDIAELMPGHIAGPSDPIAFTEAELLEYLETHLDPVIEQCRQRGVYAIVDFHRHWTGGDGWTGDWDDPQYQDALFEEVDMFWDIVAPRYADQSHVLYEVYNEPTTPGIWGTPDGGEHDNWTNIWLEWKEFSQPWVDTIREHADNIVIIGSPSWTQSPEGALVEPYEGENLAYAYHIYPGHTVSGTDDWAGPGPNGEGVNHVYEEFPLFVTEFGWDDLNVVDHGHDTAQYLAGTTSEFGEPFMDFLESSDAISWTAWCAHPTWLPAMFSRPFLPEDAPDEPYDNPYEDPIPEYCEDLPCEWDLLGVDDGDYDAHMGGYIKDVLEEYKDDLIPGAETPGSGNGDDPSGLDVNGDGNDAQDLTGDGLYEDITGDGNLGFNDVVTFFEEHNGDVVQSNVEYFDFSGNGSVGFNDVVSLFERL
ncbi:hypothetical protein GCM10025298_32510 [Natronobiforma cellulositropha]